MSPKAAESIENTFDLLSKSIILEKVRRNKAQSVLAQANDFLSCPSEQKCVCFALNYFQTFCHTRMQLLEAKKQTALKSL